MLVVLCVILATSLPDAVGLLLLCWFVGGFAYLVATMRPRPPTDEDDGAVV